MTYSKIKHVDSISFTPGKITKKLRKHISFLVIISAVLLAIATCAMGEPIHVRITVQPSQPNGMFHATIDGADFSSKEPNPCSLKRNCYYTGYANAKSWGENGLNGYGSQDQLQQQSRIKIASNKDLKTVGEVLTALRDAGLLYLDMRDYLGAARGKDPTFCIYASDVDWQGYASQIAGTLLSNCADAIVPPANCSVTSPDIEFNWGAMPMGKTPPVLEKTVSMHCDSPTNIQLAVSGESIVLNGDSRMRALIDLGNGWTGQNNFSVDGSKTVPIKAKLEGVGQEAGAFSGSAILLMGYQ